MILSDSAILREMGLGTIKIQPFNRDQLGSNSYDVLLGKHLAVYQDSILDAKKHNKVERHIIDEQEGMVLYPNIFYLGTTFEYTETHSHIPFLEGKSSTGRLGISIHETAGKGDIGFCGHWTLEITVQIPVRVYYKMPIGQIIYHLPLGDCLSPYSKKQNAKYSQQSYQPVESMMWKNKF